ncbi:MAG: glycosyltransferase [Alphaproteobacteria bacterium]|nr:glycosyltransferase [Alphaproteobacteria bacterium]
MWNRFGPYHVDRCAAAAERLRGRYRVYGIEIAGGESGTPAAGVAAFPKITLFPRRARSAVGETACCLALVRTCLRLRARHVFTCSYEDPGIFIAACLLRLLGRTVWVMQDTKFDDKPRRLLWELVKRLWYAPYRGAIAGSRRAASYLEFLGLRREGIFLGYNAVAATRVRALIGMAAPPAGTGHGERHFTLLARSASRRALAVVLDAYAAFVRAHPTTARPLYLCGARALESDLRRWNERLGPKLLRFAEFEQQEEVANLLSTSLALIVPCVEEQEALAINAAVTLGVPVLVSDECGARDLLVRSGVNGYVFEPDNVQGIAHFLSLLHADADEWRRLSKGAASFTPLADTEIFAEAVDRALSSTAAPRSHPERAA